MNHCSSKTILFIRRGFSRTGGAESYLIRLAEGLSQRGYRVILLNDGKWPETSWPGGEVIVLPGRSLVAFARAARLFLEEKKEEITLSFSFERIPGVTIFRAGDGIHAAWLRHRYHDRSYLRRKIQKKNLPLSYHEEEQRVDGRGMMAQWKYWIASWMPRHRSLLQLERELFAPTSPTEVILNSQMVDRELEQFFDYPQNKRHLIYNGVPLRPLIEPEQRSQWRYQHGLGQKDFLLLFVGSGWERKGLFTLFQALAKLEKKGEIGVQLHCWIAGKGKQKNFLGFPKFPSLSEVKVRFLGGVPRSSQLQTQLFDDSQEEKEGREIKESFLEGSIEQLYAMADTFILPTRYDPFSNASLEALSAGLPVITTRFNGCSEILEEGCTGSIIEDPDDVDALGIAIAYWIKTLKNDTDPRQQEKIREGCHQLSAAFPIERNVEETLRLMASLK